MNSGSVSTSKRYPVCASLSTRSRSLRVLICDDHELVRLGVRQLIEAEPDLEVVGEASDGGSAVAAVEAHAPDVVVMDVRMPGSSGIEACREIRSRFPATRVLMLTSFADHQALFVSTMAGASGYVLKQIRGDGIVDGVRRVAAGESLLEVASLVAKPDDQERQPSR
ncbi:MAG: response regulator transcription factor [Candidatus Dormibacteraeota bacterium]|uniref:Response regulator transcription factor n=1 Tax=Candidatus Amunia macphersoniae TaxID=3127014 RepID=A0A934KMZ0_9BACT|nr:response regulator transcription factor [Candidatus Dormibacteraeota bacterium]